MSVFYVVIYKKTLFMQRQRGRSTTRNQNQPKGPRSNSTASTKTENSDHHKHPHNQQNSRRSSSRNSMGRRSKSNHGRFAKIEEPTPKELEHRQFIQNQQALINEVIAQMTENEVMTMLKNIHTNGELDAKKSEAAIREYEDIGKRITTERDDARITVGYKEYDGEAKKAYDVYWKKKMGSAMAEFRTKYHLPPALPRALVEKVVRENINEIAVKHMLNLSQSNDTVKHNEINQFIRKQIQEHVSKIKKHNSKALPFDAGSQASAPTNAGEGSGDSNGGEQDSSDALFGSRQETKDTIETELPSFSFAPTLWPTEAYTRGESLRYL